MSRPATPPLPAPVNSRPRLFDYLLFWLGCAGSVLLAQMSGVRALAESPSRFVQVLIPVHPYLFFLPLGVLLFWPLFYLSQRLLGRKQPLTLGEWLWGLAWLLGLVLAAWMAWNGLGTLPEALASTGFRKTILISYMVFVLLTGGIALILLLIDLVGRWPRPWTHTFGLVLMIWPLLPLAALWAWNIKLESQ